MELHFTIPKHWNDLSLEQQLKAYAIIMSDTGGLFEEGEIMPAKRILLFQNLTGITNEQLQAWKADRIQEDPEHGEIIFLHELNTALESCNFLFDVQHYDVDGNPLADDQHELADTTTYAIALHLTRCPWPALDRKKKNGKTISYYAPADKLANISFLELCVTFSLFEQYLQDYDEDLLNELLAVLYRSPKPRTRENKEKAYGGDQRQPYMGYEALVPKRKRWMATLPERTKQLMVFWFASCRQTIINQYPDLFNAQNGEGSKYGWGSVLMAMADGIQYLDAVSVQPASDALTYLDYLNEQAMKREKEAKK
jgi:hypothetical protein